MMPRECLPSPWQTRSSLGQSIAEFALVIPVVLLLLAGLFDLGRLVYAYNTVSEAARYGARLAIVNQSPTAIQTVAAQHGVALGIPVACTSGNAGVCVGFSRSTSACIASVTVTYKFGAITPLVDQLVGPITVASTSKMPIENESGGSACTGP